MPLRGFTLPYPLLSPAPLAESALSNCTFFSLLKKTYLLEFQLLMVWAYFGKQKKTKNKITKKTLIFLLVHFLGIHGDLILCFKWTLGMGRGKMM